MPAPCSPTAFIARYRELGGSLLLDGSDLLLEGPDTIRTPAVLDYARRNKDALRALLAVEAFPQPDALRFYAPVFPMPPIIVGGRVWCGSPAEGA